MRKQLLTALACVALLNVSAQENPLWMRFSAISPDGQTIAFSYQGDIYTVAASGGEARQLTTNPAYDAYPIWSPDGQNIAFASTREGSFDVYLMNRNGGNPTRLTTHSNDELPLAFKDNEHVLFKTKLIPTAQAIVIPRSFPQVYEVSTKGERPRLFSVITMEDISINSRGDVLYHDYKG